MRVDAAINPKQIPPGANTRSPQRWDPSYAAVAVTLIGGIVYVFFRVAYASFYAALHTTPEEVGLGYSQTIVRGVIPSITIALSVFVVTALLVFILVSTIGYIFLVLNLLRMRRSGKRSLEDFRTQVNHDSHTVPSLDQYRDHWRKVLTQWKQRYPRTAEIFLGAYNMSDEEIATRFAAQDAGEAQQPVERDSLRLYDVLTAELRSTFARVLLHKATVVTLLILTLSSLTFLIRYQAHRVAGGHSLGPTLSVMTGIRAEQTTVSAVETGKTLPTELTARPVIYLGASDGTAVILIPEGGGSTVRVPLNDIVLRFKD